MPCHSECWWTMTSDERRAAARHRPTNRGRGRGYTKPPIRKRRRRR